MGETHEYAGLPGVKAKSLRGPMFKTASGAMTALRSYRTAASAGDHGATHVWIDDDGNYRGSFMRYHVTHDEQTFKTKRALRDWIVRTLPKQQNPHAS